MKPLKRIILLMLFGLGAATALHAQSDLEIRKAFERYGEKKNVVMVELTDELLEEYDFKLFKSLTIKDNPAAADFIRKCIAGDEQGAKKVKHVVANGVPTSIYLQLPRKGQLYRLILFNETHKPEHKITLIYIESKNDSEDVLRLILKKK